MLQKVRWGRSSAGTLMLGMMVFSLVMLPGMFLDARVSHYGFALAVSAFPVVILDHTCFFGAI